MTGFSSSDFCKLSVQEVADLLLDKLAENDKDYSCARLHGKSDDDRLFELDLIMREAKP